MTSLLRLLARQYAGWTTTWLCIVGALVLVTLPSYASTYPDESARLVAVELAQNNAATTLLYGRLSDPGSPVQMFAWETGTFVTLLVAVLGVLMTVRLTRVAEQEGTIEIVRSAGLGRLAPLTATFVVLAVVGAVLGLVSAAAVGMRAGQVDGVDWTGSLAFGSVVALTFLLMALITVILAQLVPTAWSARVAGALALAGGFALRAAADTQDHPWLQWITPLGLRATVEPFTSNSPVPLVVSCVVVILLGVAATALERSRELGGSILRVSRSRVRRVRVSSPLGLAWRLRRATTLWWVAGIALGGALFTAMGASVVETARQGQLSGGFLEAQLAGGDPVSAFFEYTGTVVAIVVAASGILSTLEAVTEESKGPGEYLRATGTSPARVLAGHLGVALIGSALALGSTAAMVAIVAPQMVSGPGVSGEAFQQVIGQWSGVLVLMGPAILLAGWSPKLAWLGWIPYAAGAILALLGTLLSLPQALINVGPFNSAQGVLTPLIRLTVFAITAGVGLWAVGRRDLTSG
jgi:ABC-2 type transport system permease protein